VAFFVAAIAVAFAALSHGVPAIARPVAAAESDGFAAAVVVAADFVVVEPGAAAAGGVKSLGVEKKP